MSNRSKRLLLIVIALLFGLFLAACGGGEEAVPPTEVVVTAPTEEATAVPEPTEVPPTSTPEPSPTPDPLADFADFESAEGGFTIKYPESWATNDLMGFVVFASAEELLDSADPGEEGGLALVITGDAAEFDSEDPVEVLNQSINEASIGEDTQITDGPTATTINGQDAAVASFTAVSDNDTPLSGYIAVVMGDNGRAAIMIAATPTESEADFLSVFETMASTITVTEPVVTEEAPEEGAFAPESSGILLYGDTVTGEVTEDGPSIWDFIGLSGETIDLIVEPVGELDVIVDILDSEGVSILENGPQDNSFGREEVLGITIPADGTYYVYVDGFSGATGEYSLSLGEAGTVTGSEGSVVSGGSIEYGQTVTGAVEEAGGVAAWTFTTEADDVVGVIVTPDGDFDAVIDVLDESGVSLLDSQRDASFGKENLLIFTPGAGAYTIQVSGFEDSTGSFTLEMGYPMTNFVSASDTLEEEDLEDGHLFPFDTFTVGDMVGIVVAPVEDLDVAIQVRQGEDLVEGLGFDPERGFDSTVGTESFVFAAPEEAFYAFRIINSEDDFGANTGEYDVTLIGSSDVVFELALGDAVVADTGEAGFVEYTISASEGRSMTVTVKPDADADLIVDLEDLDGNSLVDSVDAGGAGETETLTYEFPDDKLVLIRIREFLGGPGGFSMSVASN